MCPSGRMGVPKSWAVLVQFLVTHSCLGASAGHEALPRAGLSRRDFVGRRGSDHQAGAQAMPPGLLRVCLCSLVVVGRQMSLCLTECRGALEFGQSLNSFLCVTLGLNGGNFLVWKRIISVHNCGSCQESYGCPGERGLTAPLPLSKVGRPPGQ